jgi:two-component system NtrC family sensor kinase
VTALTLLLVAAAAGGLGLWWGRRAGRERATREVERALGVRKELNRRLNEVFSLHELTYILANAQEPDRIAEQVVGYVMRFVDSAGAAVCLADPSREQYRVTASGGTLAALTRSDGSIRDGSLVADALLEGQVQRIEGTGTSRQLLVGASVTEGYALAMPLPGREAALGALVVRGLTGSAPSADHLRLLSMVATHAGMALANARYLQLVRAARDQWETTFDGLPDGVALVDREGRVRRANRALALLLGRPLADVIGLSLDRALFGSPTLEPALRAAATGAPSRPETARSDLLDRELRFSVSPVPGAPEDGWAVALVEDVTEERAMEAKLILSERMAAMGQLVSGVAHELNNPLTSIAGLSEFLVERPPESEPITSHLQVIREQADRASRIVRDLLTFARHGPEERGLVDVNEVAERSAALIGYEVGLHEIDLQLALDRSLPPVEGDRYQVEQIVLNLLTNALHAVSARPPGGPRFIRLETEAATPHVVLRVVDSGSGIPPELLPKIFEPFTTTKEAGQGIGLGLSIIYRIVHGHGGTIAATSDPDSTVFTVRLPEAEGSSSSSVSALQDAPAVAGGRRILLIDADPGVRRMIGTLFAHEGHDVEIAEDADDGMVRLARHRFDLVIGDARAAASPGETL